jgi:uncharacterized protein (DUF58 family)
MKAPELKKGEFILDYARAISRFENAMNKFPVKKILYKIIFRGKGLEFDSYREFEADDDASMIDWKASLRANQILARKYVEERDLNVYFLVDVSNSMLFGSGKKLKAEFAAEFVAALSHLIIGAGDRIGLVMFNDDLVKILRASADKNQSALFRRFLSDPKLYGGGFDLDKAIEYCLRTVNTPYTIFILVSDFVKIKASSLRNLKLMGHRFETLAFLVRDKFDEELPNTKLQFSISDPYSGRQMILDPQIAGQKFKENVALQKKMLNDMFKHSSIDHIEFKSNEDFAIPLSTFLRQRARGSRL